MYNVFIMVGMVFGNVFLGIFYFMVYKVGGRYYIFYGRINVILLLYVVLYNGIVLVKLFIWLKYIYYVVDEKYMELVRVIGLDFKFKEEGVKMFVKVCYDLVVLLGIDMSFVS